MKCLIYLMATNESEMKRQQHAAIQYCAGRGWDSKPSSEAWTALATRPGEHLPETMAQLAPGDVLLIGSIASLAERPSQQEAIIRKLIGSGVRVHSVELGDINMHLPGMFAAWQSAANVEAELERALSDMATMEQRHESDLRDFEEDLTQRILAEGVSLTVGKANGHASDHSLGEAIKHARIKRNMSQRALGELAGISHTQVGRLEAYGYGEGLQEVLAKLELQP
jgi:hypothetical protein